ncbi:unnamed protein product [Closterium sp. NIES-54]
MASLHVLTSDHEGRPIQFDTWLDSLQLYLLSDSRNNVSLFDHTSGASIAPLATADRATRSQWLTRVAAACLAICNHLPLAKCAHFRQHKTAKAVYDVVVARYSSPATAALGRLLVPYLFPKLSAFATVEDLVSHLRTTNAHLIVDLLKQHLLGAETSVDAVGAAHGTPRTPFSEGCSPSPLAPSYASAAAVDVLGAQDVEAASTSGKRRSNKGKGGRTGGGGSGGGSGGGTGGNGGSGGGGGDGSGGRSGGFGEVLAMASRSNSSVGARPRRPQQLRQWFSQCGASGGSVSCPYVIRTSNCAGQTCGKPHTQHCYFSRLDDTWRAEYGDETERPCWADLIRSGVAVSVLDNDAILAAMYALCVSAKGDCYRSVPPDPWIEAAALGASESALPSTAPAKALHTFTLDSGASRCFFRDSTTLNPLSAPVPVRVADPSGGRVLARSSIVLPCPAVPSGLVSSLHLPSFSMNLVSTAALQDAMVTATTPGGQPVSICTCTRTCRHLTTFTRRPRSSLYTLAIEPHQVAALAQTLLLHHHLGHPSLPRLRGMHSRLFVSGLPKSLPPLPPSPAPPCLPCVEGRQRAAPHSSSFPPTTAPLQTLHMDRVCQDLPVLRLHSDRGGEFSSTLLRDFCRGEGILQSFRLPASPQENGIDERRIGLVMEVARTSMIHAAAPHFLWLFAVQYAAHQLNLWPRVSLPKTSPTLHWTGKVGDVRCV